MSGPDRTRIHVPDLQFGEVVRITEWSGERQWARVIRPGPRHSTAEFIWAPWPRRAWWALLRALGLGARRT